jgi:hypothetical protein
MKSLPKGVKSLAVGRCRKSQRTVRRFCHRDHRRADDGIYAVLVLLFGTFLQPITILFSLPLSIGGAIAALLLTGKQLTTPVWIGIPYADGHRHQERHHAGGIRRRIDPRRTTPVA